MDATTRETSEAQRQYLVVDDCRRRQTVKQQLEVLVQRLRVESKALVLEAAVVVHFNRLVVATQQKYVVGIFEFVRHQ